MGGGVKTQIAVTAKLTEILLDRAGDAEQKKRRKSIEPCADTDALGDECGNDAHEGNCHGETVPEKSGVARVQMVVTGAECGEEKTEKEKEVGPAFALIEK